ncbi:HAMP domain-containing histidine kinase [Lysobacter sp. S4-A87]|uniref:sensor histidine kinase n=1 Tax=Lysobacter sp. S4-A87 TaxID=2925843 RepID=UPI001F532C06|nr:HAMP domain-containing sensor histidine kinase [Lysobacter sp. S4-A87]UNK49066.1 HAMP domain-containing histidine kinase [Lysobacter sp. S4-A87]
MRHGLPRRIKLAFITQALIGSIVITVGILLAGVIVRQEVIEQRVRQEAQAFWKAYAADPHHRLPSSSTMSGYVVIPGQASPKLPAELEGLGTGVQRLPDSRSLVYVDRRPQGTLYLVFSAWMADQSVLMTGLVSLLLSLLTSGVLIWLTYRTSKRLVTPVSWLANQVAHWDPRDPDASAIAPARLPADASDEVRKLSKALTGLSERVGDFVRRERNFTRDASHELRTPLTVIRVATDLMLADPETSPRAQRSLARVQQAGRDMESVIEAFLILAREADVAPQSEEFEVRDIVAGEVERIRPMLAGRPVEVLLHDEGGPRLVAPPHVLRVMVGNLLSNAVRFTGSGQIEVRVMPDRVVIRDSGIGMSPEVLAKAFDPFFRAEFAESDGKGMGLSIVRRLGERFGWPVSLASEPGQGTTAVIRFQ